MPPFLKPDFLPKLRWKSHLPPLSHKIKNAPPSSSWGFSHLKTAFSLAKRNTPPLQRDRISPKAHIRFLVKQNESLCSTARGFLKTSGQLQAVTSVLFHPRNDSKTVVIAVSVYPEFSLASGQFFRSAREQNCLDSAGNIRYVAFDSLTDSEPIRGFSSQAHRRDPNHKQHLGFFECWASWTSIKGRNEKQPRLCAFFSLSEDHRRKHERGEKD